MPLKDWGVASSWLLAGALLVSCSQSDYNGGGRRTDLGNDLGDGIDLAAGGGLETAGGRGGTGGLGGAGTGGVSGEELVGGGDTGGGAGVRSDR